MIGQVSGRDHITRTGLAQVIVLEVSLTGLTLCRWLATIASNNKRRCRGP